MDKQEFIALCSQGGYCTKRQAEEYARSREEFTEEDMISAYRKYSSAIPAPGKWTHQATNRGGNSCKTTYRNYGMKSNYFDNWG